MSIYYHFFAAIFYFLSVVEKVESSFWDSAPSNFLFPLGVGINVLSFKPSWAIIIVFIGKIDLKIAEIASIKITDIMTGCKNNKFIL
jgi:hypothetical protein